MDPAVCREHLSALLTEELKTLAELESLLNGEHEVLVANDVAGLERTAQARQDRIGALVRIEDERRTLCSMHGHSPDLQGLERLLAWCDPSGSLKTRWKACADGAGRCRDLNERNGALVNARLKRVEGMLGVLTGRTEPAPTYNPQGAYAAPRVAGRVLGEA